jgi:hypothetical protein
MNQVSRRSRTLVAMSLALGFTSAVLGASQASAAGQKSIRSYVSCTGTSDDSAGAAKAFAAAKNSAFTLVVDCPVRLHSGIAVDRGIFIDSGTTVEFTDNGKFIVDNLFHPAFTIVNSNGIHLTNWNVVWDGMQPINGSTDGYEMDGKFVGAAAGSKGQPAAAFNDTVLARWMSDNRGIEFSKTQGWAKPIWVGAVNLGAVFYITGDSSDIVFKGLHVSAPPTAGGDRFIPMVVSFSANWKNKQTVTGKMPHNSEFADIPHKVTFADVVFDGILMGWQGNVADATFDNVQSHRYGDLQDAGGGNSGGVGKWYPPPHLFYLNYTFDGDPAFFNPGVHISNVVDSGPRVGVARDKGGSDSTSGYATSLKLGCTKCSVDHYSSTRPDGFMDVLPSTDLTVSNVTASYDTTFLNNVFPAGIRFPAKGYTRVTFENVVLTDTADSPVKESIANAPYPSNDGIKFKNVQVVLNSWPRPQLPQPTIGGANNDITIDYLVKSDQRKAKYRLQPDGRWNTSASP